MNIYAKALLLLSLCLSLSFASTLEVKVTVSEGTVAIGTNVSILKDGVELAMQKADAEGKASFSLQDGGYFVLLRRGGYPLHVSLVELNGNTSIALSMRQQISYANVYGQLSGPPPFSNYSITAFSGGEVVKRAQANSQGLYFISFLPEGQYELVFESPGYQPVRKQEFLPSSDFVEANAKLVPIAVEPEQSAGLFAPLQVQQYSTIVLSLKNGTTPLPGRQISVNTPSGALTLSTDSSGEAKVNAAEPGTYEFAFGDLTASTEVNAASAPLPTPPMVPNQTATAPPEVPIAPPSDAGGSNQWVAAGVALAIFALAAGIAVFLGLQLFRRKGKRKKL